MKKSVLLFSMTILLLIGGINMVSAQEQPKPKKDTINMDTDAKPTFYYAVEDEKAATKVTNKSGLQTVVIIAGVAVIVGITVFFLLKKKK
jgi:DNA/RNA endonuclease YhcR with UshA esterase domain